MKHVRVHYEPRAEVHFTGAELKLMLDVAEKHYDGVCRNAASKCLTAMDSGRPGFLRGMYNATVNCGPAHTHILILHQIHTLEKIMEMAPYHCQGNEKALSRAASLSGGLARALQTLNRMALEPAPVLC